MQLSLIAEAEVELFSVLISGVAQSYTSGCRLNFFTAELGCTVVGEMQFPQQQLTPGSDTIANIAFFDWAPFKQLLKPGLELEIRDQNIAVGYAKIIALDVASV